MRNDIRPAATSLHARRERPVMKPSRGSCHFFFSGREECSRWRPVLAPAAAGSGFNISSKGNDDFAELAAVLQIAVHFHHLVELENTIDDRLESAARKALGNVLHRDLSACLVA